MTQEYAVINPQKMKEADTFRIRQILYQNRKEVN